MATVKGLTIDVGVSTTEFNKGLKAMNKDIRATQRDVNALSKSLEIEFDAGRFSQAQKLAQQAIEQTDNKAKYLKDRLKALEDAGQVDTKHYKAVQSELIRTETEAVKLKQTLKEIKDLKIEELQKKFNKLGDSISEVGQKMMPLSLAAAGLLASFAAVGKKTVEYASELNTLSTQVGLSAEALQKWQYVAIQTGISTNDLQKGLVKIGSTLNSLALGEINDTTNALRSLGISSEQASLGMEGNIDTILLSLASMEDKTMQAYYANLLFGDAMAAKLIPLLDKGAEGINEITAEFASFNTLTNEQVASLNEFGDVMNKIKFAFETMRNQLGVALLPLMTSFSDTLNDKIIPAIQKIVDWFTSFSVTTQKTIAVVLAIVAAIGPLLLVVGKLTKSLGGLKKVFNLLATHPIIAIIGVIVALLVLLYSTNEEFRASIDELFKTLSDALMPILETLMDVFNQLLDVIMPILTDLINELVPILVLVAEVIGAVVEAVAPLISMLIELLMPILTLIIDAFGQLMAVIMPIISTLLQFLIPILSMVVGAFSNIVKIIIDKVVPIFHFFKGVVETVFGAVRTFIENFVKVIENVVNGIIRFINKIIDGINALGKHIGVTLNKISEVSLEVGGKVEQEIKVDYGTPPETDTASTIDTYTPPSTSTTNNNYDNKTVNIEVVVQNYAEELDVDDLVRQINIKLAEAM